MELIRGRHNLRARHRGCVATIGNFDGVHRGHRALLARLAEQSRRLGVPSLLMTFEPQPLEFLRPQVAPPRITGLRDKLAALTATELDRVLIVRFDARFAAVSAEDFVDQLLVRELGVRYLLIGDDFRFGQGRRGDAALLEARAGEHGFGLERLSTVSHSGERVSSTRVRQALQAGDLTLAADLLGRPYRISGRVARGDALGRTIGFPTANLVFHRSKPALEGVFVVKVHGLGEPRQGVASLGTRPTVNGQDLRLEVHLFDFDGDLYGRHLEVEFLQRLRGEERFDSMEAMRLQIERDAAAAREFFDASPGGAMTTGR